jgi:hypothetical protein
MRVTVKGLSPIVLRRQQVPPILALAVFEFKTRHNRRVIFQ